MSIALNTTDLLNLSASWIDNSSRRHLSACMWHRKPNKCKLAVGGSLVISIGALTALGIYGGMELHNRREIAAAMAQSLMRETPEPSEVPSGQPSLRPSLLPTMSSSPSIQPSISAVPSTAPSNQPSVSGAPSNLPSQIPTASTSPSVQPSTEPSLEPSASPSSQPTSYPSVSNVPTFNPTRRPTRQPTAFPTRRPTNKPVGAPSSFRLRLYWENGYMWQESPQQMWFCMACAYCDANDFEDNCSVRNYCNSGMMLALTECKPNKWSPAAKFKLLPGHHGLFDLEGDQIQVSNSNLCLSLTGVRAIELENCDASKIEQRFKGFRSGGGGFELAPAKRNDDKCLTQHHHPREGERIFSEECRKARISDTNLWTVY